MQKEQMSRVYGESFIVEIRIWVKLSLFYKSMCFCSFVSYRKTKDIRYCLTLFLISNDTVLNFATTKSKSDCESFYIRFLIRWKFKGKTKVGSVEQILPQQRLKRFICFRGLRQ